MGTGSFPGVKCGRSVLLGKPGGRRPLGRPRCRLEDIIKMNIQEVGRGGHRLG